MGVVIRDMVIFYIFSCPIEHVAGPLKLSMASVHTLISYLSIIVTYSFQHMNVAMSSKSRCVSVVVSGGGGSLKKRGLVRSNEATGDGPQKELMSFL